MTRSTPLTVNLDQRVALVTGAGRGIGRACALALAEAGARTFAVARSQRDLDALAAENPLIEPWAVDVLSAEFIDGIEQLERLDILVNNAGTNRPQPFVEVDADTLDTMLNLNVRANFLAAQAAARVMRRGRRGGSIIHMSSQMGHVGSPGRTVYCMTKHAVEGLTRAMAVELAPENIRVNAVAPTFIETPLTRPMLDDPEFSSFVQSMIPLGRVGQVEDVASAVLYLASDAATMVTGHSLRVDGGWTAA
ncbi:MAG: SDR family oxidoreductase [Pseudomonadota bacterium]